MYPHTWGEILALPSSEIISRAYKIMYTGSGEDWQVVRFSGEKRMRVADFFVVAIRPICYFDLNLSRLQTVH
jgi:hypothetical protein